MAIDKIDPKFLRCERKAICLRVALFVGIDVSKEKFDACGIRDDGTKVFSVTCPMNRAGFEKLMLHVPKLIRGRRRV